METWRKLSFGFAAGGLGAVALVVFLMIVGALGIPAALGISAPKPQLPEFLYSRIVWGGIWGFLLVVPVLQNSWWQRGLVLGVLVSLAAFVVFFPMIQPPPEAPIAAPGMFALGWGAMMPVLVLVANLVWGLVTAYWYSRMVPAAAT